MTNFIKSETGKELRKFISGELLISAGIVFIAFIGFATNLLKKEYYLSVYWVLLVFFLFFNTVIFSFFIKTIKQKINKLINRYISLSVVKFFVYLLFIFIYLLFDRNHIPAFLVAFFSLYLMFTVYEVKSILSLLKKK